MDRDTLITAVAWAAVLMVCSLALAWILFMDEQNSQYISTNSTVTITDRIPPLSQRLGTVFVEDHTSYSVENVTDFWKLTVGSTCSVEFRNYSQVPIGPIIRIGAVYNCTAEEQLCQTE